MTDSKFQTLEEVIQDEHFPDVDLALRRGRHIARNDDSAYEYLMDALDLIEPFYERFGCQLMHQSDGYFYLLPSGDKLGRRQLSTAEMIVGQCLALMYMDPATLQLGGIVTREDLLQRLSGLIGTDSLVRALNPRRKKFDERVAAEKVRGQVSDALRKLSDLGFVDYVDETRIGLRPALLRFAEPVRDLTDPSAALSQLVARGEILMAEKPEEDSQETEEEGQPE